MKILSILMIFLSTSLFSQSLNFTLDEEFYYKNLEVGATEKITWESSGVENIKIEYSIDDSKSWIVLEENYPAAAVSYDWIIPNNPSIYCKIRITDVSNNAIYDIIPKFSTYDDMNFSYCFTIYSSNKWSRIKSPTSKQLTDVKFIDEMNGIAWGNEVLIVTEDGGKNWVVKSEFDGSDLTYYKGRNLSFIDENFGWKIEDHSDSIFVLKTRDGGVTWVKQRAESSYSDDYEPQPRFDVDYKGISFIDTSTGILSWVESYSFGIGGSQGRILKTSDGGESWKEIDYRVEGSVKLLSEDTYWIRSLWAGEYYSTYRSHYITDDIFITTPYTDYYYVYSSSYFLDKGMGGWHSESDAYLSSNRSYIMDPSTNKWTLVYSCANKHQKELYFYNSKIGWFEGAQYRGEEKKHSIISMTTDGGLTWELQQFEAEEDFPQINSFFSLDGKTCWAVGNGGTILKYENNTVQNRITAKLSLESPIDNSVINLASSSFTEGQNYFIKPITLQDPYQDLEKEANIFEGTRFSLDDGAIYENIALDIRFKIMDPNIGNQQNSPIPELPLFMFWGIEVTGEESGVTSFEDFYKFSEGNTARICIPQTEQFMEILKELEIDITEIDFAFLKGGEYITEGIEWELKSGAEGKPDSVCIYLDHFSQIVGGKNLVTSVEDKTNSIPTKFGLEQNYPNPFNPTTTISYSVPSNLIPSGAEGNIVQLIVYDVLGKEVQSLVNKNQQAGKYEVSFDASNLSSGIYYYQLKSGSFVETKKMILMK